MKRKDVAEPRLVQRSQDPLAESPATDVAPVLATNIPEPSDEATSREAQIRELAFSLYEQRGRREGCDVEDWLEAEAIINNKTKAA
jgi:hypothetical protein